MVCTKTDAVNLLLISATWIVMVILVNPLGNFPLNDDWVYALSVKAILEKGRFEIPAASFSNAFPHAFWGALFCLPFGFSFMALRFSTLILGLVGIIAVYGVFREVDVGPKTSLLGALLVAVNPLYFSLSNTFMTDVPFFALTMLSLYFLIGGLKRDSNVHMIIGILISYAALLNRQAGLVISLAFGIAYLARKGFKIQNFVKGFIPLALGICIQIFYQKWLYSTGRAFPAATPSVWSCFDGWSRGFPGLRGLVFNCLVYTGFFIFPLAVMASARRMSPRKNTALLALPLFFAAMILSFILKHQKMPFETQPYQILAYFGLGPLTLRDTMLLGLNYPLYPFAMKIFWLSMTVISAAGAALLLYYLWLAFAQIFSRSQKQDHDERKWLNALLISAIGIYVFIIRAASFIDRYLLFILPLSMAVISLSGKDAGGRNRGRIITALVLILMLIYGGFTVAATHDYLAWNRTRWQALNDLTQKDGIPPGRIDGGYEFNGWYLANPKYETKPGKSWWWVSEDDYVITSGPLPGYEEVKKYPVKERVFFGPASVSVMHRTVKYGR